MREEPLTVRVLVLLAGEGEFQDFPLGDRSCGCLDDLRLAGHGHAPSALLIRLQARLGGVSGAAARGRCSQRLCWPGADACLGGLPFQGARARLRRDATSVDWRLSLLTGGIEEVRVGARVERLHGMPGWLQEAFG